jgi:transposase
MSQVQLFRRDQFVFVDETGCKSEDHMRRFGHALRGKSPVQHGVLHKGGRISAMAAIASTGVVAVDMTTGSVNGEVFFENARSIVLDNCSIHHVQHVIDLFAAAGILVLFLSPYSPDYMPIEEIFSYVKYYLKKHVDLWELLNDPKPLIQAAFASINCQLCNSWISDCGQPL